MNFFHESDVIINIKPQKQTMDKVLRFNHDKIENDVLKRRSESCRQFSFICPTVISNSSEPQKFIPYLKQLKSIKYLTIDLTYFLLIPKHFISKIFTSLKYLKSLSVLHFEPTNVSFYLLHGSNLQILRKNRPIVNNPFRVQVKLSLHVSDMTILEGMGLRRLLESLCKLERFTSLTLVFASSAEIGEILEVIDTLKASKSLAIFSLTFEKCNLFPSDRLHELFLALKEIKSLKCSEILFK